jgi:hypothetical protein
MKKAAGKRITTSKKKVGSLRARSGKTGNVKGGGFLTSATAAAIDGVGKALATTAQKQ